MKHIFFSILFSITLLSSATLSAEIVIKNGDKIAVLGDGAHARIFVYRLAEIDRGNRFLAAGLELVKRLGNGSDSFSVLNYVCVGSDDKISVCGGRNKNALSVFIGATEYDGIYSRALALIENVVLSATVKGSKGVISDHSGDLGCVRACRIYKIACGKISARGANGIYAVLFFNSGNLAGLP